MSIRGQLSDDELTALLEVSQGRQPWRFALYEPLRAFSHAIPRLGLSDLPTTLNFGDALRALDEILGAETPGWSTHPAVSAETVEALRYASTSAGITRLHDEHEAAWREHAAQNRALILRAARQAHGSRGAVIGAGKLYDIPLRQLAQRFDELFLVDVDGAALAESVAQAHLAPALRRRLTLIQADVTGINDVFLEKVRAALDGRTGPAGENRSNRQKQQDGPNSQEEQLAFAALLDVFHSYRLTSPPRWSELPASVDFVCSSMVLSQLAVPMNRHAAESFAARFPASGRLETFEFQVALGQFSQRVQLAHLTALLAAAPCVALTSDVSEQYTTVDARHAVVPASPTLPLLGAPSLADLVPTQLEPRILEQAHWVWRRVVPSRGKPHGRVLQVSGLVLARG
jgi:hypothetical protein